MSITKGTITYKGERRPDGVAQVIVHRLDEYGVESVRALDPRTNLRNHSPTGFEWGYEGSGPAQLALAILADRFGDRFAELAYQRFKRDVIATLHRTNPWAIDDVDLDQWLKSMINAPSELGAEVARQLGD